LKQGARQTGQEAGSAANRAESGERGHDGCRNVITDPWFYVAAVPAVLLTGISKSGFGGATGGLAVPLMTLTIAPPQAAAIMLPILLAMDLLGLGVFRDRFDRTNLRRMLPGAILGITLGALTFGIIDPRWIRLLIGIESVTFALERMRHKAPAPARTPLAWKGWFWGAVSGFTSFISHAGGPPAMQFLLPQRLDHRLLVGTTVYFFATVNLVKLVPYVGLGLLDTTNLATTAALLPAVPVGYWLGLKVLNRLDAKGFNRILSVLLLITGGRLIWDAWRG
jgi:uncharacterized protein